MTLDFESIEEKMKKLYEAILVLEEKRKLEEDFFIKNLTERGAVCYYLVIGIEAIADVGNHFLSKYFHSPESKYEEIIKALGKRGVVSQEVTQRNDGMANFRNLLVHMYAKVKPELVYEYLQKAPDEFREYAKAFRRFLDRVKKNN